jgi:general secretion pathway protein G
MAVLLIFTAAAIPMAKNMIQRQKEIELRRALRELRTAIDRYRQLSETQCINPLKLTPSEECVNGQVVNGCYPRRLDILVQGVELSTQCGGGLSGRRVKLLREIPVDPMTGKREWGTRSFQGDEGGTNVFDVYSKSSRLGLDGTPYKEW